MDRLWTVLVFVAVLGLRGAAGRDKTNMPKAKQEEGQSNNAAAMGTVVPDPSAGGRVDPELLAGMYNRRMDVPIGREPSTTLDGATVANLSRKAELASNTSTEATANGTVAKGENVTSSSAGNATISLDGATHGQMGGLPRKTNVTASGSIVRIGLGNDYQAKIGALHSALHGEPVRNLDNRTWAQIGPLPNITNVVKETLASAGNWTAHVINATSGQIGSLSTTSADASGVHVTEATRAQMGPLLNASASTRGVAADVPADMRMEDGGMPADENSEKSPLQTGRQTGNDYRGESLWTKDTSAFNGSLENGYLLVNVDAAVERYRLAQGAEPQVSNNRSNDPDVVAMREIASAVLDGPEQHVVVMTDVVIRSVLPDVEDETMMKNTELHEAIRGKFEDEDLMKRILEGDANQAPARPEQGPCETCPQPVSVVCSLCWPVDFCRPFASKVDIPCPVEHV